jgi:hypothetical protein
MRSLTPDGPSAPSGAVPDPLPSAAARVPRRCLTPDQVVAVQLAALRRNDLPFPDTGIALAYRFASPESRATCGPLPRFIRMLHAPAYAPLLGFASAERRGAPVVMEGLAQQRVAVVPAGGGAPIEYRFTLTRHDGGPFDGCWMTDSVVRLDGAA